MFFSLFFTGKAFKLKISYDEILNWYLRLVFGIKMNSIWVLRSEHSSFKCKIIKV